MTNDIICVVKCDAYGLGAREVVRALTEAGATKFAVATVYEGAELRRENEDIEIIVMGFIEDYNMLIRYNLTPVIFDKRGLEIVKSLKIPIYIKINTGMNRLGFRDLDEKSIRGAKIIGIMSHLGASSIDTNEGRELTLSQYREFEKSVERIQSEVKWKLTGYINNSAGLINFGGKYGARVGLALYGGMEGFKSVVELRAKVIDKHLVKKGEYIGYDMGYRAKEDMDVAIVSIGYGDGLPRVLSNNLLVNYKGKMFREVGLISMDSMVLDATGVDINPLDDVTIFSDIKNFAVSPYELLCGINKRVKRVYGVAVTL